jgi:hypothetical protein
MEFMCSALELTEDHVTCHCVGQCPFRFLEFKILASYKITLKWSCNTEMRLLVCDLTFSITLWSCCVFDLVCGREGGKKQNN